MKYKVGDHYLEWKDLTPFPNKPSRELVKVGDLIVRINNYGSCELEDGIICEVKKTYDWYRVSVTHKDGNSRNIDTFAPLPKSLTSKTMKSPLGRCYIPVPTQSKWNQLTEALEKHEVDFKWKSCGNRPTDTEDGNRWKHEGSVVDFGRNDNEENEMDWASARNWHKEETNLKLITFEQAMRLLGNKATSTIIPAIQIDGTFYTKADLEEKIAESEGVVKERKVLQKALKTFKPTKKRGRPVKAKRGRPPLKRKNK